MYVRGTGVDADPVRAVALYKKAAGAGIAEAMTALGDLYAAGHGVAQDLAAAAAWYEAAAGVRPIPQDDAGAGATEAPVADLSTAR
jgi:TPR repeat protein